MKHPLIIGAGGVASYLLPVLIKAFRPEHVTIVDKDVLEERNLDRQMFREDSIGAFKADALICAIEQQPSYKMVGTENGIPQWSDKGPWHVIRDWFTESTRIPDDVDAIICCADNHEARYAAMQRAEQLGINAYVGGNEYFDSQAFLHNRDLAATNRSALVRYPNIATDKEGSPINCTGEAQVSTPQLAVANFSCAAKLLHLMWVHEVWVPANPGLDPKVRETLPVELFSSLFENSIL